MSSVLRNDTPESMVDIVEMPVCFATGMILYLGLCGSQCTSHPDDMMTWSLSSPDALVGN